MHPGFSDCRALPPIQKMNREQKRKKKDLLLNRLRWKQMGSSSSALFRLIELLKSQPSRG
uniref:Uncharacterized protein n=1 Tax=Anguilla anguilla TaxID=7936 RepID=A0A0E9W4M4_ANGAN